MAYDLFYDDRMRSLTSSTGAYELTLVSGSGPWRPITKALIGTKKFYYCIVHENGIEWEVGRGQMDDGEVMYRDEVLSSSDSGASVDFTAGEKEVFITLPAFVVKNIHSLGERNGIPSHAPSKKLQTTTATQATIDCSGTGTTNTVREFIVCAYSGTGGSKNKVWRITVTSMPGVGIQKTVEVISESETLPWTLDYAVYSDDMIYVTGAASTTIWWYVHERVLGRFE